MREFVIYTFMALFLTQCPIDEHRFSATVAPPGSGTVSTDSAYYRDRAMIEIRATPNEGWEFAEWTGDTTASSNPLIFTITRDMNLTANFRQPEPEVNAFFDSVTVSDAQNSMELYLGMQEGATAGYDPQLDLEAPPQPPSGSFFANFLIEDYNLRGDMRPLTTDRVVWQLEFAPQEGQGPVSIRWDFSDIAGDQQFTLADRLQEPAVKIDMRAENKFQTSDYRVLYIIKEQQQ
ncbi:MAG: hypothetical protein R3281_18590 [Balneolaceae bacterium]|nr:hypothetical protein [Balneolaceae bacterium]